MRRKLIELSLLTVALGSALSAQVLTLDEAIALALHNNRGIKNAALETARVGDRLAALRTKMFPSLNLYVLGAQQLQSFDFTLERGLLGVYPGVGPIPDRDTTIRTPRVPTGIMIGRISQPLTPLHQIKLNLKLLDIGKLLSGEQERAQHQDTVRDVKQLYYGIQQLESSLRSAEETVKLYRELVRLTADYVAKQTALPGDNLQMQTSLARAEQSQLTLRNQEATQKEQLNQLMSRNVLTEFTVSPILEAAEFDGDIAAARKTALDRRPEARQSRLKVQQAEQDRLVKKSEYIPTVSVDFNSITLLNYTSFLPTNINNVGVSFSWEPFDWGRRRHELVEKGRVVEEARNSQADAEGLITIDVDDKFRKFQQAQSQLRVVRLSQETALENLRVAKNKYEAQASLLKDLLQAQTSLEQANADFQQALAGFWTAKAQFERALGEDK